MTDPLLQVEGVAKAYGPVVALRSVDLAVRPGEVQALAGANGAGKSTLVKILTGILAPDAGRLLVRGSPATFARPTDATRAGLASVYQDPALAPDLTVRQNLRLTGTSVPAVQEQLAGMGLAGLDLDEQVRDLPLPFLRMIDLARALAADPALLLLDEITAALPPDLSDRVFTVMRQRAEQGGSVLFISHRLAEIVAHCDACTVLRDGRDVSTFVPRETGQERIVKDMLGAGAEAVRSDAPARVAAAREQAGPRLSVQHLVGGQQVRDVSFDLRPGEVLGMAALEGQGQDMLFELLAGNRRPDSGEIVVEGRPMRARHPYDAIRRGVVLVPADRVLALLPQRPIRENIALPLYMRLRRWGLIRTAAEQGVVRSAVERLSIDTRAASQARRLSGGNQQKLTIGRWLAGGFRTLLLFDPTRGIDIGTKHQIYELIRELADGGAAVLLHTSELREIELVCDRAIVLYRGQIVTETTPDAGEKALLSAAHGFPAADTSTAAGAGGVR